MSNTSLTITLAPFSGTSDKLLFLEQEEYPAYLGKMTRAGMVVSLMGFIFPETDPEDSTLNCGGEDGLFKTIIHVYRYDSNLNYDIAASHGLLGMGVVETLDYIEYLNVSKKKEVKFTYPANHFVSFEWQGETYNTVGEVIPKPAYELSSSGVTFDEEFYGTFKVRYSVIRHNYELSILSRAHNDPTIVENKYSSVVYATWDSGIDWEEIDSPFGFEDFDGNCGGGPGTINPPSGPEDPPNASPKNVDVYINYCSQEVIRTT